MRKELYILHLPPIQLLKPYFGIGHRPNGPGLCLDTDVAWRRRYASHPLGRAAPEIVR